MSTALATLPPIAAEAGISLEIWNSLTNSIFPGAKPESIVLAYQYCKARRLDVLAKPVHIVPMSVKIAGARDKYEYRDVIMQGIHSLRTTASRTGLMAGTDAPVFGPEIVIPVTANPDVKDPITITVPQYCSVTVWRNDGQGGRWSYTNIEYFDEAVSRKRDGLINDMWRKRPHGQLAKCAEAGALRKAFPEELGGEHTIEEMEGKTIGGDAIDAEYSVVPEGDVTGPEEVRAPQEVAAKPAKQPDDGDSRVAPPAAAKQPAPADKPKEPVKEAPAAPAQAEPAKPAADAKIELPDAAHKLLARKLADAGITEAELLAARGTINIQTINAAFLWIKEHGNKDG